MVRKTAVNNLKMNQKRCENDMKIVQNWSKIRTAIGIFFAGTYDDDKDNHDSDDDNNDDNGEDNHDDVDDN